MTRTDLLGRQLFDARARLGDRLGRRVTLQEFGKLLGEHEQRKKPWPHATISRWERGIQRPTRRTLYAIAELTGTPFASFNPHELSADRTGDGGPAAEYTPLDPPIPGTLGEDGYSVRLMTWLYGFLLELARAGASRSRCNLADYWLTRPLEFRRAGEGGFDFTDDEILVVWEEMANTIRWAVGQRGATFAVPPREPTSDVFAVLGGDRRMGLESRRRLELLGRLAAPDGFEQLLRLRVR